MGVVLGEHPRLLLGDVAIDQVDELLDGGDTRGEVKCTHRVISGLRGARQCVDQYALSIGEIVRRGQFAIKVAADHGGRPRGEIAQPVRELGGIARRHVLPGERPVLTKLDRAQKVIAECVGAEVVDDLRRCDAGELGLAHLLAADQQPAVGKHLVRKVDARRHQHRRPVDRVKSKDVLAHQVHVCRPRLLELLRIGGTRLRAIAHRGGVVE